MCVFAVYFPTVWFLFEPNDVLCDIQTTIESDFFCLLSATIYGQ